MLISFIIPVYNVEKYLPKCINSILDQNFDDFEVILVDDGSQDRVPMICDEYREKDGRAVITSDGVGCKDTVIDGYNGFIVPKGDYKMMAEKVIWCIEHPQESEQMGKNARQFAENNFDSRMINEKIYDVVLQNAKTNE